MKFKIIALSIGLIFTILSGGKNISNYSNITNGIERQNIVSNEVVNKVEINDNNQLSLEQEHINNTINQNEKIKETIQEEQIVAEVPKETKKAINSQNNKASQQTETIAQTTAQETPVVKEPASTIIVEAEKKIEQPQQPASEHVTASDLKYWCVEGGAHHVLGDSANEHGYYSSWDEANQAFQNYTAGWLSVQYKIEQCACGLFYFWAIQ